MDYLIRALMQYMKANPDMLLDVMIALGEGLERQPKEKQEKFLALLEKQIRKRIDLLEKNNRLLQRKVVCLEKDLAIIKKQLFVAKQVSV